MRLKPIMPPGIPLSSEPVAEVIVMPATLSVISSGSVLNMMLKGRRWAERSSSIKQRSLRFPLAGGVGQGYHIIKFLEF